MAAPPDTTEAGTTTAAPDAHVVATRHDGRGPLATAYRYLAMPLLLATVLGLFYLYIQGLELDTISARELNRANLVGRLREHLSLSLWSTLWVLLIAVPLGIAATRPGLRRVTPFVIGLGNAGQAIPSLGMLGLLYAAARNVPFVPNTGPTLAITALTVYSFLPILRNTMIGLDQVDRSVIEAARGMGLSNLTILRRVEMPLAVPVILAGVRTALVLNIGTAALAFVVGGGGLGVIINGGFQVQRAPILLTGAVLVGVLALFADYLAGIVEERLTPKGL